MVKTTRADDATIHKMIVVEEILIMSVILIVLSTQTGTVGSVLLMTVTVAKHLLIQYVILTALLVKILTVIYLVGNVLLALVMLEVIRYVMLKVLGLLIIIL